MVSAIKENVERIRGEIAEAARRAGRSADEVRLMGVTKFHPLEMMLEAAPLLDLVGENRVQEAAENAPHGPKARRAARGTSSATFSGTRYGARSRTSIWSRA